MFGAMQQLTDDDTAIDRPEALAHAPLLVRRLQRLRETRRGARSSRRVEVSG